jgi:hypothetical protein
VQFRQAVHGSFEQLRLIVFEPVPTRICRSVLQPERRREIDDARNPVHEFGDESKACFMWQTQEDDIDTIAALDYSPGVRIDENEVWILR